MDAALADLLVKNAGVGAVKRGGAFVPIRFAPEHVPVARLFTDGVRVLDGRCYAGRTVRVREARRHDPARERVERWT
jgi:hypothetical protein